MTIITVTNSKDSGTGSLRDAIARADNQDTIVFSSKLANQTIRLQEQLVVDKSLTIDGSDAPNLTLSGENKTRILQVSYNYSDVVLRDLTFANGRAVDNDPNTTMGGGAIELIDSNNLVVENSRFLNNVGERSGAIFVGYGSRATITDSVFDGNDGSIANDGFSAGAISTYGGGEGAIVVNSNGERNVGGDAFLDISGSTFTNNVGTYGAVYSLLSGLKVEDSVFRNNQGKDGSGAIFTDGANGTERADNLGGTTLIRNVIAEDNIGGGDYGGAFFLSGYSKDKIVIEDSTIANNTAFKGGGLAVQSYIDEENPVSLVIRNSTIADNNSPSQGGGLWTDVKGGVQIEDSTFSGNRVTNPSGNGEIGGAIVLNYKTQAKSNISNTTFIDNYSDIQSGAIWIAAEEQGKNLTIENSRFKGNRSGNNELENTVNFQVIDGGNNLVQNTNGADTSISGATLVEDLQLSSFPSDNSNSETSPEISPKSVFKNPEENSINPEPDLTKSIKSLRYEAEKLTLNGYQVETVKDSGASDGKHISLKGTGQEEGFAEGKFTGETGKYQVKVGYYDENDGQSEAQVSIGGKTTSFVFDQDLPNNWTKPASKTNRIVIEEIHIESGDTFKIAGSSNKGEYARFDYIEFTPIEEVNPSNNQQSEIIPQSIGENTNNLDDKFHESITNNGIVDLRNIDIDQKVVLTIDGIQSTASYSNSGGFYQVVDLDGTVIDPLTNEFIQPGEEGYETTALTQRLTNLDFHADDSSLNTQVDGGMIIAPYLISNGSVEELISKNPDNNQNKDSLNIYFAFGEANPKGLQHLQSSDNSFGFEDKYGGGDQDFNDLNFNLIVEKV
ncbi:MAG: DUF4114 domain-containing protein [Mastigocoleus sp.]